MAEVRQCRIPEDLYYWVDKHIWMQLEDGVATVGITAVASHLAKKVISVSLRPPGRTLERGKSAGTLESGKWVGPVPVPVTGTITETNEALKRTPDLINQDPYGAGWILKMTPTRWEEEKDLVLTGDAAIETYRTLLEREGITCA